MVASEDEGLVVMLDRAATVRHQSPVNCPDGKVNIAPLLLGANTGEDGRACGKRGLCVAERNLRVTEKLPSLMSVGSAKRNDPLREPNGFGEISASIVRLVGFAPHPDHRIARRHDLDGDRTGLALREHPAHGLSRPRPRFGAPRRGGFGRRIGVVRSTFGSANLVPLARADDRWTLEVIALYGDLPRANVDKISVGPKPGRKIVAIGDQSKSRGSDHWRFGHARRSGEPDLQGPLAQRQLDLRTVGPQRANRRPRLQLEPGPGGERNHQRRRARSELLRIDALVACVTAVRNGLHVAAGVRVPLAYAPDHEPDRRRGRNGGQHPPTTRGDVGGRRLPRLDLELGPYLVADPPPAKLIEVFPAHIVEQARYALNLPEARLAFFAPFEMSFDHRLTRRIDLSPRIGVQLSAREMALMVCGGQRGWVPRDLSRIHAGLQLCSRCVESVGPPG